MANSYDFLSKPKHHHAYRLIVLVALLSVILVLGWLYANVWSPYSPPPVMVTEDTGAAPLNEEERTAIMVAEAKSDGGQEPLSEEDRLRIMTGGR